MLESKLHSFMAYLLYIRLELFINIINSHIKIKLIKIK